MMMVMMMILMMMMMPCEFIFELKMFLAETFAGHPLFDSGHEWNFAWFGSIQCHHEWHVKQIGLGAARFLEVKKSDSTNPPTRGGTSSLHKGLCQNQEAGSHGGCFKIMAVKNIFHIKCFFVSTGSFRT